jgi:hypothetical protein
MILLKLYTPRSNKDIANILSRRTLLVVSPTPYECNLSYVLAGNPLVAFYNTHRRQEDVLFSFSVPETIQDNKKQEVN